MKAFWEGNLGGVKRIIYEIILGWSILAAVSVVVTGEYTVRHLLFPLATAVVAVWGESFHEKRKRYWVAIFLLSAPILSVLLARLWVAMPLRFWEFGTVVAFSLSIAAFATTLIACVPISAVRIAASFFVALLTSLSAAAVWGHIFAEGAWPNADSVFAVLQSNPQEAYSYLLDTLGGKAVVILLLVFLFAVLTARVGGGLEVRSFSVLNVVSVALFFVACVAGLGRTRENIMTIPVYETESYIARIDDFKQALAAREQMKGRFTVSAEEKRKGLFVLVIGESETRDHLSAFGYHRKTTPWMDSLKGNPRYFFFNDAYACYVQTVKALSYALTAANQYNGGSISDSPSLIEAARAAGYKTAWLSNQLRYSIYDTPTSVIADSADIKDWINSHTGETSSSDFYDGALVDRLRVIPQAEDVLVVIHLMGSHNSYEDRFPSKFGIFSGAGSHLVDEYDGSVLYTDYVLRQIYETVSALPNFQAMIYFSDHGEGVDDGRIHGTSNFVWQMARIPLFIAVSPQYALENPELCERLKKRENAPFTNDLIFDLMLGMMRIQVEGFCDERNDISSQEYDDDRNRFLTLYGEKRITEDDG